MQAVSPSICHLSGRIFLILIEIDRKVKYDSCVKNFLHNGNKWKTPNVQLRWEIM